VAHFRIDNLGELARQLEFTPQDARLAQITAAEELLHSLDPLKAYPYDFIVHRITGYRPKQFKPDLLTGLALQHDLGMLIEQVSDTLTLKAAQLPEPVLDIADVTERFNVTSKTIQRWRRRGLPARRFVFADGKRRVGFLLSSVERFFSGHKEQVVRGMNFSQVSDEERDEILRRARRLAVMCHCCTHEIARRIARKMNRSPLTIQHTIRKHDQENPGEAIFPQAAAELREEERSQVLRGYRRGVALRSLAKRVCRDTSAVYRVILEERLAKLSRRKIKFIDDPLYHGEGAADAMQAIASQDDLTAARASKASEEARVPRDLPPYLQDLYRTPLLTPPRERALFLEFNYRKYQFVTARRKLEPQFLRARDLDLLEGHLRRSTETKNAILRANLRLVVSIARKHLRPGLSLMELISDGNMTLMRAVEGFDVHRGHRFSTYATLALMKGFARSVPQMLSERRAVGYAEDDQLLAQLPDRRVVSHADRFADREEVSRLLSHLTDRERMVLLAQYGLEGHDGGADPAGLAQKLGVSRQQLRQIEKSAMAKLRSATGVALG